MPSICVIGAGVIGLSSALHILDQCPGSEVVVVAEKFSPFTTTDVSGGFWEPYLLGSTPPELIRQWSGKTLDHMLRLSTSDSAKYTGASQVSGYQLHAAEEIVPPEWKDQVDNFRMLTKDEARKFPDMKSGYFYTTVMLEPMAYMQWLMKRFQRRGGRMKKMRVNSIEELSYSGYDVIVNCTGLGSNELVNDTSIKPVRGQVIRAKAPWIKHFYVMLGDDDACSYVLPAMSYVVLGGTQYVGDWNTNIDHVDKHKIWDNCVKYVPSLSEATVDSDMVGLRPARTSVRLESETIITKEGKSVQVVHNYGHGGSGVTLHWGCAEHAARLVVQALEQNKERTSKL